MSLKKSQLSWWNLMWSMLEETEAFLDGKIKDLDNWDHFSIFVFY